MIIRGNWVRQWKGGWINMDYVKCFEAVQVGDMWEIHAFFEWVNYRKVGEAMSQMEANQLLDKIISHHRVER